jgi:hypothetical protein
MRGIFEITFKYFFTTDTVRTEYTKWRHSRFALDSDTIAVLTL